MSSFVDPIVVQYKNINNKKGVLFNQLDKEVSGEGTSEGFAEMWSSVSHWRAFLGADFGC